jgi:HlyD family secretion protein
MRRKIIAAVVALGLLAAGVLGWSRLGAGREGPSELQTTRVERGPIQTAVACTGRVVPNLEVQIKCKASGEIIKLPFDVSDQVNKDDLLLQIDPIDEERMLEQCKATLAASQARLEASRTSLSVARSDLQTERMKAQANLKSAEASARDAKAKAQRMKELLEKKLTSPEEAETAETSAAQSEVELDLARIQLDDLKTRETALDLKVQDIKLAEANVTSDDLKLKIQEKRWKDTNVFSPITGVVATRDVQMGQIISSGISNVGGGTTAMVLSDLSRIFVLASVDESDIGRVKVDQAAAITADAFPGTTFEGKVIRIATQGVNLNNVVTFEVKIEVLDSSKSLLKPEMTANVAIITSRKDGVLLVPVDGVIRKAGEYYAEVVNGDVREDRKVQVGLNDSERIEIVSGLSEGDTVVLRKETLSSQWSGRKPTTSPLAGPSMGRRPH